MSQVAAIGRKPLHRLTESFLERVFRLKVEELFGPADIQAPARLPVGLGGVPIDLPCKTGFRGNHGGKIANPDFFPCPEIDGQTSVILFGCAKDTVRGILHVQELSVGDPSPHNVSVA